MGRNSKVARTISGLENADYYSVGNDEAVNLYNEKADEYIENFENTSNKLEEYAKQFNESNDLEIKAIKNNMLIYMFEVNPFQHLKTTESGFVMDLGGRASSFESDETGELKEEEQFIKVGTVFDAGPDCKFAQDGDCIMFTQPSAIPVPFFNKNMFMVNEDRILAIINSGLQKRFSK